MKGRNMRNGFMATAVVAGLFGNAAQAETYICSMKSIGRDMGWISKTIAINIDDNTSEILVSDAIILGFNKKPIQGRLSKSTEKRVTVTWEVRGAKDAKNNNVARFLYRATIYKRTNKIIISAQPSGYHNSFSGKGVCKLRN